MKHSFDGILVVYALWGITAAMILAYLTYLLL